MAKTLIIGTQEFQFPVQGENSDYGEEITSWAEAVTDALSSVQQPNDVTRTSASILNNVSTPTNIPGFIFDVTEVRSINAEFLITRTTTSPAAKYVESGFIEGNYNGSSWTIILRGVGSAGVDFDITPAGQITYISSNIAGTGYEGSILFRAKVFNE